MRFNSHTKFYHKFDCIARKIVRIMSVCHLTILQLYAQTPQMKVRVCWPMRNPRTSRSHQASTVAASAQIVRRNRTSRSTSGQWMAALTLLTCTITLTKIRIPGFPGPLSPRKPSDPQGPPGSPGLNQAPRSRSTTRRTRTFAAAACAWGCTACAPGCRTASDVVSSGCAGSWSGTVSHKIATCF